MLTQRDLTIIVILRQESREKWMNVNESRRSPMNENQTQHNIIKNKNARQSIQFMFLLSFFSASSFIIPGVLICLMQAPSYKDLEGEKCDLAREIPSLNEHSSCCRDKTKSNFPVDLVTDTFVQDYDR